MKPTAAPAATRTLANYAGGDGARLTGSRRSTTSTPPPARSPRGSRCRARPRSTPPWRPRARRSPSWAAVPPQRRARAVMALREALWEHREEIAQLVTADMGKAIDDARGEVCRGIESTEAAIGDPSPAEGREPRGRRSRRRRGDGPPAGRRGRRDHPVQLPGDDPAVVPALRDRVRQHVHPQAVRARPAPLGADVRADRRDRRDPRRRAEPRARRSRRRQRTARPRRDRRDLVRRPGLDRPLHRRAVRAPPASASRRSAGRRTRW